MAGVPLMGALSRERPQVATCMPPMTATFTRTPGQVGKPTTMEVGIRRIRPRRPQLSKNRRTISGHHPRPAPRIKLKHSSGQRVRSSPHHKAVPTDPVLHHPPKCRVCSKRPRTDSEANSKANASSNSVAEEAVAAGLGEDAGGNGGWAIRDNSAESRNPAI